MPNTFKKNHFTLVKSALSKEFCEIATKYSLIRQKEFFNPETYNENRFNTHAEYADTLMESILDYMHPKIEKITKLKLYPTYSYYRVYKPGDILQHHIDKPSCEISATICLGYNYVTSIKKYNWGVYAQVGDNDATFFPMKPGDMVVYRGCDVIHWRDKFEVEAGSYQAQTFIHYVEAGGEFDQFKYDGRPSIGYRPK